MTSVVALLVPSPEHNLASHPENVGRFARLEPTLRGLEHLRWVVARPNPDAIDLVARVHPRSYLDALREACQRGPGYLDPDTYVTPASFQAALDAAAGTVQLLDALLAGDAESGFALIRPPGHHASGSLPAGFCLLNNLAIAARHAQAHSLRRIMIVDFDVHHGNGTQAVFWQDPEVLYVSTHQWGIYPGSGAAGETGEAEGAGTTVNIPLPAYSGDATFRAIGEQILIPLAERFQPELLLASAGFDGHWRDPLAQFQLTSAGYHRLASDLHRIALQHCSGKCFLVLEGGYDPEALASGVAAVCMAMTDHPPAENSFGSPSYQEPDTQPILDKVRLIHDL